MKKILRNMAMLSVGCLCLSASAIDTVDLGAIELGKTYSVPDMCSVTGTITAPSTGTLLQDGVADISLEGVEKTWAGYGNNGQVYSYSVTEGQTYTASCDFVFSGGNVVWKMQGSEPLAIVDLMPKEGSVISTSTNGTGEILLQFNAVVTVTGATMEVNGKSAPLHVNGAGSVKAGIAIRSALAAFYADGTLSPEGNETVTITLTGVEDSEGNLYNGTGEVSLSYVSAPKAIDLVSVDFTGRKLKSFYAADDAEGILTFVFDGDVLNDGRAVLTLSCGAPEVDGGYYYEQITPAIDGNVVKVDLTGKLRDLNSYLALSELPYVGAKLSGVRDLKGNIAAGDSDQNVGSYNYYFTYDYIEPVTISSEFVPANGGSLDGVDQVEIWFNNADKISFDGVLFSCPAAKAVVPMAELKVTREGNDITILAPVPAEVKGQKGVVVTLNNMVSLDGYDHTKQVKAVYDGWVVTLVSPIQDDGTYATTGEDDFVFSVNEAYGYMRYDLYNGEDWVYGSWLVDAGDGTFTSYNGNWPLYKNMENRMLLRAYDNEGDYWNGGALLAETEFFFNGLTEGFTYSDVKFVSIDPEANSQITPSENFHFTLTFDGLVNITSQSGVNTGFGSFAPFEKMTAVDPEETSGLSSVWELYPSSSNLKGTSIDISVYAYDQNGKLIEGNMGGGETDYLQFSFSVYNSSNFKEVTLYPAPGENLTVLNQIEVSNANYPTGVNYAYDKDMPFISDKLGNTVYTFEMNDFEVIADPASSVKEMTYVKATLRQPIEEEGSYMVFIPEGFFILGAEFETYLSQEVQALYTIGNGAPTSSLVVEPQEGANVESLDYIKVITEAEINTECEEYITLYSFNIWSNIGEWSQWSSPEQLEKVADGYKLNLEQTLSEDGEYSITIPAGFFILDGKALEGAYITFTVGEGGSQGQEGTVELTLDPAPGSTVEALTKISIDAPGIADSMANWDLAITVTNAEGEVIRTVTGSDLSSTSFDWETWTFLGYALDFTEDPITEAGVYTVNIPNGMFEFFDMSRSMAIEAVYTVGTSGGNDDWDITLVSPIEADGTYATTGEEDFVFTMTESYGYMRYDLYNGEEWVYGSWLVDAGEGRFTSFNQNWPLYKDMENRMVVRGYENEGEYWNGGQVLAQKEFFFNGLTEGFTYSPVKFVSIDPEANSQITPSENFHFTLTFDGPVTVTSQSCVNTGFGSFAPFAAITPVDPDEAQLAAVWELYPASANLTGTSIDISVYAYDAEGRLVEGNMGGGETDYLQFSFAVYNTSNFKEVTLYPAPGETLTALTQIEVSNANYPTGVNYAYDKDMPFISDKLGNTVYTFSMNDFEVIADPASSVKEMTFVKATLREPIEAEGSYMLFIPEGFFILGAEFETYLSQEVQALYTIGNGSSSSMLTVEPAEGANVESLDYIMITTAAEINTECEEYITLYSFNIWSNVAEWSQWSPESQLEKVAEGYKLNLDQTLTEDGEYALQIPEGFFILDGQTNEWTSVTFTVGNGGSQGQEGTVELTLDPAPGSTVEQLTKITIDAPGIADSMANWDLAITVTNEAGEVIRTVTGSDLSSTSFDWETWTFLGFALDFTEDPITEAGVYTVNIPNGMFEFFDMSRSKAMEAVYTVGTSGGNDDWDITLVSPIEPNGTYATTGDEDFVFTMTQSYGYMRYDLYNGTEWVYGSWLVDAGEGRYTAFNMGWPLYKDMENRMVVRGYENEGEYWNGGEVLVQAEFFFNGLTEGFSYSPIKFVSIDPEPNTEIIPTEDFHFTVTFDGPVTVTSQSCVNTGFGSFAAFESITPVDAEENSELATVWALYPRSSNLTGTSIDISVYAYDAEGRLVEGNMGGGEYDYLQFSYSVYNATNFKPVSLYPAAGSTLTVLNQIEISNAEYPTGVNYGYDKDMPFISDKLGNTVYTFSMNDFEVIADPASSVKEMTFVKATLREPIETEGSYMLFIPEGFFILGAEFETYLSEEVQALYTIGNGSEALLTVEPGEGAQVDSLDYIMITTAAEINTECEEYITLYSFNIWSNIDEWSQWSSSAQLEKVAEGYKLNLAQTLTEDGEYALNIPEGFFILGGQTNEWTSVTFTVGNGGSQSQEGTVELTLDPAPGSILPQLAKINIDAPGIADSMANWDLAITVTNEDGVVVRTVTGSDLSSSSFDWDTWTFLGYALDFTADPIKENGVYTVDIPNGMFEFFDMSRSKALTAVYTVDSTTAITTILVETAPRYEVYTINGVKVLSTENAAELGRLDSGMYIINGKKVLVK